MTDRLRQLSAYAETYMAEATQLATYRYAREWMEAGVPVIEAAAWASLGYQPAEAEQLIASRVSPAMAAEMDDLGTSIAGGSEARAADVIDRLVAEGVLVDPAKVRVRQDLADDQHAIVDIDE